MSDWTLVVWFGMVFAAVSVGLLGPLLLFAHYSP